MKFEDSGAICVVDSNRGIYAPQEFAKRYEQELRDSIKNHGDDIMSEDINILLLGPQNELYDDVWGDILHREITVGGKVFIIHQDGDVFLVPKENYEQIEWEEM